ncbi:winged helix-turn-helix transcriptional regulator [Hymenobacter properus]|uniref:Helix-turn-helix transcriptional regulator n=1 Tax=Hymenobacter properus TaxID=2791026 RepID=A0A931BF58_9BACT|nr:helix-turn-helix domain-containing protein [Hymenobacter properus]MBF9140546.1 helix-turn-helix transcriptional regulator [Hymenobacter properus]MBR7719353.1 helix-turn-helix transcriptional regulator [Microvirga sp. SRT04]
MAPETVAPRAASVQLDFSRAGECRSAHRSVRDTLDVVGGKWKLVILAALAERKYRFKELSRALGISPSMLSKELQEMEMDRLVTRTVLNTTPQTVEYEVTEYSKTLGEVLQALRNWGEMHHETIVGKKRQAVR